MFCRLECVEGMLFWCNAVGPILTCSNQVSSQWLNDKNWNHWGVTDKNANLRGVIGNSPELYINPLGRFSNKGKVLHRKMEKQIGKFFESVGTFFSGGDQIPWCDGDIVAGCEREVAEAVKGSSDELKSECIMRLSWALVHSKRPEDVQRGIAMLEASLAGISSPLQMRENLYLLAIGYYRSGDYSRSRQLVERCLEIAPDWRQALTLKKAIEDRITKDGVIGIGIAATAVGLLATGVAAALSRKK